MRQTAALGALALVLGAGPLSAASRGRVVAAEQVVIQFQGGSFEIVRRILLATVLPPADSLPSSLGGVSGFWYELRGANGELRYRRLMGDPVRLRFEGPDDPTGPFPAAPRRSEGLPAQARFSALIPRPANGDQLLIFSGPFTSGGDLSAAREVARFPLIVIPPQG